MAFIYFIQLFLFLRFVTDLTNQNDGCQVCVPVFHETVLKYNYLKSVFHQSMKLKKIQDSSIRQGGPMGPAGSGRVELEIRASYPPQFDSQKHPGISSAGQRQE
jgi:hypothetical protein